MSTARIFVRSCVLQYRALFNWATPVGYVSYKLLLPIAQIVFFVQLGVFATGHANALYFAVGNALQLTAVNGIFGVVMAVGNERQFGTLPILLASPADRLSTFLGRAAIHVLDGITSVLLGFAVAWILYGLNLGHANLPLLLGCIVLISLTTAGLGLMFGSFSLIARDIFVVTNTVYFLLLVVCGINFPVSRLPGPLQVVSNLLPMTHGVAAARQAVAGASLAHVAGLLLGEAAIGLLYAVAGYALFRQLEHRARQGGLQDAF